MTTASRRLVLHIGPHKTASSYIQVNLKKGGRVLGNGGWLYPSEGTESLGAHHHLAHNANEYLPAQAPYRNVLKTLGETARAKGQSIVLSAEGFCRWKPANFDVLSGLLGFDTYELVYVVRDPLDVFPSFWAEEVKQGRSMGLAERFAGEFADPMKSRLLNPMRDLNPLLARDRAQIHAVPYDILKRRDIDIFENLTGAILDLQGFPARHAKPVNVKYPIELTEFLRLMTLIHGRGQPNIGSDLRLKFTQLVSVEEQRELQTLVRKHAHNARRVITVPGDSTLRLGVENILKARLKDNWSIDVGKDEPLFSADPRKFVHYDAYLLSTAEPVRQAAEAMVQRLMVPERKT
ncbi:MULTISPECIES: hypothetical protein [unclassified Sulfitobacter]|nr:MULTISPECIES: hypothetical protein [unclassified Sulfitobacter]KZX98101.1 hypothetical protein A3720_16710 [Sulfitobacter sp. HI0021]KZY03247.1 hypothetical protein A3722_20980 [Sulfitobacter sp. HI0027]